MNSMTEKIKEVSFYHTTIKEWPEGERPREKLLKSGPQILSDAELLAILIGSGTDKITALDLAKRLLVEYESLTILASKGVAELTRLKGVGPAKGN
jgi:DNA repair protein RadC